MGTVNFYNEKQWRFEMQVWLHVVITCTDVSSAKPNQRLQRFENAASLSLTSKFWKNLCTINTVQKQTHQKHVAHEGIMDVCRWEVRWNCKIILFSWEWLILYGENCSAYYVYQKFCCMNTDCNLSPCYVFHLSLKIYILCCFKLPCLWTQGS